MNAAWQAIEISEFRELMTKLHSDDDDKSVTLS
jgi:hypothetical protein